MTKSSRLTISVIEATRPTLGDKWLSDDDGGRGTGRLAIRISSKGSRLFYFRYSEGGKRIVAPLGAYAKSATPGCLTLEEARDVVSQYSFSLRTSSVDLKAALLARLTSSVSVPVGPPIQRPLSPITQMTPASATKRTLLELCQAYAAHLKAKGAQSAATVATMVRNHVEATFAAAIPANELSPEKAAELIRRLVVAEHLTTAKHLRQMLSAAYNLAMHGGRNPMVSASFVEFGVTANPIAKTAAMSNVIPARDRPPATQLELGHILLKLKGSKYDLSVAAHCVRLNLHLGGQRCLQLLRCRLDDVDMKKGILTLRDGKGRRNTPRLHELPLTASALVEVKALRQMARDLGNPYLIAGGVKNKPLTPGPVSGIVTDISRELLAEDRLTTPFCYANIRSTIETNMADMDVPPHIRAEIQSHDMGGVQKKNYDRSNYLRQKLQALKTWEQFLAEGTDLARQDLASSRGLEKERPVQVGKGASSNAL